MFVVEKEACDSDILLFLLVYKVFDFFFEITCFDVVLYLNAVEKSCYYFFLPNIFMDIGLFLSHIPDMVVKGLVHFVVTLFHLSYILNLI